MKQIAILFIVLSSFWGCAVKTKVPQNGIVREKASIMIGKEPAEPLDTEHEYKNGNMVRVTQFFQNGKKKFECLMIDPATNRWSVEYLTISEFYESGQPKSKFISSSDSLLSETQWFENGSTQMVFKRTAGKKDKCIRYYSNGNKKEEFELQNEQHHGIWAEWDSLGTQTRKDFYVNGTLRK